MERWTMEGGREGKEGGGGRRGKQCDELSMIEWCSTCDTVLSSHAVSWEGLATQSGAWGPPDASAYTCADRGNLPHSCVVTRSHHMHPTDVDVCVGDKMDWTKESEKL
jgi:hypothetical protein